MAKPVVFVIGASGSIGSATVSALAAKYADKVEIRAGVRNPDKAPESIKAPGVTIVQAVMGEKEKLKEIFKGIDALFIVTPGAEDRAPLTIKTAEAAKEAGVKFILVVSVPTAVALPDSILGKQFNEIESKLSSLDIPNSIMRLPFFFENNWANKSTIVGQSVFYGPMSPDKLFASVAVEDAGHAAAAILVDYSKHNGLAYDLSSDCYTNAELAAAFTEAIGVEIKYVQMPIEAMKQALLSQGWPEWQVEGLSDVVSLVESGAPAVAKPDLNIYRSLTGEEPTSMKTWVAKNAAGFK